MSSHFVQILRNSIFALPIDSVTGYYLFSYDIIKIRKIILISNNNTVQMYKGKVTKYKRKRLKIEINLIG